MRPFGRQEHARSIAVNDALWRIVERWAAQAGVSHSQVIKFLIEEHSDETLVWQGARGWQFERPKRKGEI